VDAKRQLVNDWLTAMGRFSDDDKQRILAEAKSHLDGTWTPPEPLASSPIEKKDAGEVIRTQPLLTLPDGRSAPVYAAPGGGGEEIDWSGWERWLRAHLDLEREYIFEGVAGIVGKVLEACAAKNRALELRIAELSGEVKSLRALLVEKGNRRR
jgi:hypothetical protein